MAARLGFPLTIHSSQCVFNLIFLGLMLTRGSVFITDIIIQPFRFDLDEELGCTTVSYSYLFYVLYTGPAVLLCVASLTLARKEIQCSEVDVFPDSAPVLTLRMFLKSRNEVNEALSRSSASSNNAFSYKRMVLMACIDTAFNLPTLLVASVVEITAGGESSVNQPFISWNNVHHNAGGLLPGASLSTILQEPANDWSSSRYSVFSEKWNEWYYVAHAIVFFALFGTTPNMRVWYAEMFFYIPRKLGYKAIVLEDATNGSVIDFASNPNVGRPPRYYLLLFTL